MGRIFQCIIKVCNPQGNTRGIFGDIEKEIKLKEPYPQQGFFEKKKSTLNLADSPEKKNNL